MKSMRKSFVLTIFTVSLLVISSTVTSASATKGWIKSDNPPQVRHTANNPGSTKICGDHICSPFENLKKSLQNIQKQNQTIHLINQSHTKIEKTYDKTITKSQKQV